MAATVLSIMAHQKRNPDKHENTISVAINYLKVIIAIQPAPHFEKQPTCAPHFLVELMTAIACHSHFIDMYPCCIKLTFSKVSRPLCTMLSAISTAGILPEYVALV